MGLILSSTWNMRDLSSFPGKTASSLRLHLNPFRTIAVVLTLIYFALNRTTDATSDVVEMGALKAVELSTKLYEVYLRRSKEEKLADLLPTKDERIIFCEPSPLQKELYKYIIDQPDFLLLRHKNAPCDCGVNQKVQRRTVRCAQVLSTTQSMLRVISFLPVFPRV